VADGVNVTFTLQVVPTARVPTQLLVCAKSPLFVPLIATAVIVSIPAPLFVIVMVCGALVVATV